MARRFSASTTENMKSSTLPVAAVPFTLACWAKPSSNSVVHRLMSIGVDGSGNNRWTLMLYDSGGGQFATAIARTTTTAEAISTNTYNVGAWNSVVGVYASATSRSIHLNGGGKVTETTSKTPTGMNIFIAGNFSSGLASMTGLLAELAIWNVALADWEVALLALPGTLPFVVRPEALVRYWPIYGEGATEIDVAKGFPLAVNVAVPAPHADVRPLNYGISSPQRFLSSPSPLFNPAWARGSNVMVGVPQ